MVVATATEMKNNFGIYMEYILNGQQVIITKNGKEVGRMIPKGDVVKSLTNSISGIVSADLDYEEERERLLKEKYEVID